MKSYLGNVIKQLRYEYVMSQSELADGICSVKQLRRIELNKTSASIFILGQISEKLGNVLFDYLIYSDDPNVYRIKSDMDILMKMYDSRRYDSCFNLLNSLSSVGESISNYYNREINWLKLALKLYIYGSENFNEDHFICLINDNHDFENLMDVFFKNLHILDLRILDSYALYFILTKQYDKAEDILIEAVKYIEHHQNFMKNSVYISLLFNLSKLYHLTENYYKAIQYSEKGINQCHFESNSVYLADFHFIKGHALSKVGEH